MSNAHLNSVQLYSIVYESEFKRYEKLTTFIVDSQNEVTFDSCFINVYI